MKAMDKVLPQIEEVGASEAVTNEADAYFDALSILATSDDWETKVDMPDIRVYLRPTTPFSSAFPALLSRFLLDTNITLPQLYALVNQPDARMAWEKDAILDLKVFKTCAEFDQFYVLNSAPWPMTNRDFVERRYLRFTGPDELQVVYFSVTDEDYPPSVNAERAETIIGGYIFRRLSE
jgi:hypothetical protein